MLPVIILYNIDPKVKVKECIFLENSSPPELMEVATSILQLQSHEIGGTGQYFVCSLNKGQGQIMYFLVNAYPPEPLDVANSQVYMSHDVEGTGQHFVRPLSKGQIQVIYFLVDVSSPSLLPVATSNFAGA